MSKAIKNLEVLIDWSKIVSAHAAYTEILNQIKAPKSHGHDIDSLQASLVLGKLKKTKPCLLYTSPSPRDGLLSRMPSSA